MEIILLNGSEGKKNFFFKKTRFVRNTFYEEKKNEKYYVRKLSNRQKCETYHK